SPLRNAASVLFVGASVVATTLGFLETCWLTPRAYAPTLAFGWPLAGLFMGWVLVRRARAPHAAAAGAWCCLAICSAASGYVWIWAFESASALAGCRWLFPLALGALFGAALTLNVRAFLSPLREHGVLASALAPGPLASSFCGWVAALCLFPGLGILRRGVFIAALFSALALFAERLSNSIQEGPRRRNFCVRWLLVAAPVISAAALLFAEWRVPLQLLKGHSPEVLYTLRTPYREHVFVRLQGGLLMFSDGVLGFSSSDAARFAEALVHPALALSSRHDSVLAIVDGTGLVETEILRWPSVRHLARLSFDPTLSNFSERAAAFAAWRGAARERARVEAIDREPSQFILSSQRRFDVIIADFGDPTNYQAGKYYTLGFLNILRERLNPGGTLALQITNRHRTPQTQASILATLRAAGFESRIYSAPLPVLGEWGFVLCSAPGPRDAKIPHDFPRGTSFVTASTLGSLFATPRELVVTDSASNAPINMLFSQPAVELYLEEEASILESPEAHRHPE
ncbi:MAG TPA: hypothetical protein VFQ61_04625, partial [Polyangiaceae bacterium]|nr:hypothetical protein [Polyangiaceae bacterium]